MRYRRRSIYYNLVAGLTILIGSCRPSLPQLELINSKILTSFPSASAIVYDQGKFFIFGDDAPYLLITDSSYQKLDTIRFIADTGYRLSKQTKPDIESATIVSVNNKKYLNAFGSFSTGNRMEIYSFPLDDVHSYLRINYATFAQQLKEIPELNIEGISSVKSKLVMANRANNTHKINKLIIADSIFYEYKTSITTIIDLQLDNKNIIGISDLCYIKEKDILLFTASEEDTPNAIEDGVVGDSYLGWFKDFSKKMELKK